VRARQRQAAGDDPAMRRLTFLFFLTLAALVGGCGPNDPLEHKVSSESPIAFDTWRSQAAGFMSESLLKEFNQAINDLKLGAQNSNETTGTEAVAEAVRVKINGKTVREVLCLACEAKIKQDEVELKGLAIAAEQNSRLITKEGDTASKAYLDKFREKQNTRIASIEADLKATKERLASLQGGKH
jgi:hypothetical protein